MIKYFSRFSSTYEEFASELLENLEEMFPRFDSNIFSVLLVSKELIKNVAFQKICDVLQTVLISKLNNKIQQILVLTRTLVHLLDNVQAVNIIICTVRMVTIEGLTHLISLVFTTYLKYREIHRR